MWTTCTILSHLFIFQILQSKHPHRNKMGDPWQKAYDSAVAVAKKAGEVRLVCHIKCTKQTIFSGTIIIFITLYDQVIRKAGESEIRVMTKSSTVDLVTKTDERVEKIIIGSLKEEFGEGTHWWAIPTDTHMNAAVFLWAYSLVLCLLCAAVSLGRSPSQRGRRVSWPTSLLGS